MIGESTGDIATVCDTSQIGSCVRLWTINGDVIGQVNAPNLVTSIAMSSYAMGVHANYVAVGCAEVGDLCSLSSFFSSFFFFFSCFFTVFFCSPFPYVYSSWFLLCRGPYMSGRRWISL